MRARLDQRGYLLVEVIAALTLVAIATAAILPAVSGRSERARLGVVTQHLIDLDRRARVGALREGPTVLRLDDDPPMLVLVNRSGDPLARIDTGAATEIYLLDESETITLEQVVFDRLGRSPNYHALLRSPDQTTIIKVDGLTGRTEISSRNSAGVER